MRLIVNGKAAADIALRQSVRQMRDDDVEVEVRVTWESGDASRYAVEALRDGVDIVVAAGGDGTVGEIVNGLLSETEKPQVALGIIPFGTANDFATSCQIPLRDPLAAMRTIVENQPVAIDVGCMNDRFFLNVASGGFGAEVTANTPAGMKRALGGAAYSLMAVVTGAKMAPYHGKLITDEGEIEGQMILCAIGNGRLAGGGFEVCPKAILNDGLLDVMVVHDTPIRDFGTLLSEIMHVDAPDNQFVSYQQLANFAIETEAPLQINLDGEPMSGQHFSFRVVPHCLPLIVPPQAHSLLKADSQ